METILITLVIFLVIANIVLAIVYVSRRNKSTEDSDPKGGQGLNLILEQVNELGRIVERKVNDLSRTVDNKVDGLTKTVDTKIHESSKSMQ